MFNFNETIPKPKLDWTILNDSQLDELGLFSIILIRYNFYTICNLISEISNVFVFISHYANQVGTTVGAGAGLLGAHRGPWYFQLLVVIDFESFCEPLMLDQSNLVSGLQTSFTVRGGNPPRSDLPIVISPCSNTVRLMPRISAWRRRMHPCSHPCAGVGSADGAVHFFLSLSR